MKSRHQTPEAACANDSFVDARVDAALVEAGRKTAEKPPDPADCAYQPVPKETIEPARDQRGGLAERDNGVRVKFINPHLVFEKTEHGRLRFLKRIGLA